MRSADERRDMRTLFRPETLFRLTLLAFALVAAAVPARAEDAPKPPPTPSPWLVGRLGLSTPEQDALEGISFRPFVPTHAYKDVALLAPFHGKDARSNRGIGYEYEVHGRLYVLTEWPANGGTIDGFPALRAGDPDCRDARSFPRPGSGIVWSTPRGIVATLRPDGERDAKMLLAEWHRLVRRGACR
jgi:hypothetical protein